MKKIYLLIPVLLATLTIVPQAFGAQNRDGYTQAQEQRSARPDYRFRPQDARILREKYPDWNRVDEHSRGHYTAGERMPEGWRSRIQPVPIEAVRELAPPPAHYVFGYVDGYCVAYDPETLFIADGIDLATFQSDKNPR
jgi:Ni/Co efflux regulator RcnB